MSNARTLWLLGGLATAAGLFVYARTKDGRLALFSAGETDTAPDWFDSIVIAASKIPEALSAAGSWLTKVPARLKSVFESAGARYGLPANLLERVAYQESRFREDIISGATVSSAGAVGIMQIVPKWHPGVDPRNPEASIEYAAGYLRQLYDRFGNWRLALAAYNWGPTNQQKDLMDNVIGDDWPAETRRYVAEISADVGLA